VSQAPTEIDTTEDASVTDSAAHQPTRRLLLALSYDGGAYHGFAPQNGQRTVAGRLLELLEKRTGVALKLTCAGRTDAGVHALHQVVHVDVPADAFERLVPQTAGEGAFDALARSLTGALVPDIVVYKAMLAPEGFDARRSALARRYRYDIETSRELDPLRTNGAWHLGEALDVKAMRIATDALIGEHDFAGFCRRPEDQKNSTEALRRRVYEARWRELEPGWLRFEIEAKAFCHQMVRSIVGTLVEIGQHRRSPAEVLERLRSGSRTGAAKLAPAKGLCLVAVRYPEHLTGTWA
jgi:tRNA pseudouridine38-40 synthase